MRVGKAAEEFLVFGLGVAGAFEGCEGRDVGADRAEVRWYARPTIRDLVGEPVVVGFDEVFQFRWMLGFPVRECDHVSGILLELGDLGGLATVDLADQITGEEGGKEEDGDRGGFLNHGVWTGLSLGRRE